TPGRGIPSARRTATLGCAVLTGRSPWHPRQIRTQWLGRVWRPPNTPVSRGHPTSAVVWTRASTYSFGDSQGLIRSGAPDGIDGPDVQIMTAVVPLRDFALPGPDIGEGYTIISSLMLPQTRGTVRLASATPG